MKKIKNLSSEIIELLEGADGALKLNQIAKSLAIKSDSAEYIDLKNTLEDMVENDVLERNARRIYKIASDDYNDTIVGIISTGANSLIVKTENKKYPKVVIKPGNHYTALPGDKVEIKLLPTKKNKKPKGEVIAIVERNKEPISGQVEYDGAFFFLIPDDEKYYVDFLIPIEKLKGAKHGDRVTANFLQWNNPAKSPQVEVRSVLGRSDNPRIEFDGLIDEFGLPEGFPEAVIQEALQYKVPANRKVKDRLDLRNKDIITIDPFDAKDFDDALSLEKLENGNLYLGVHIADVSFYVPEGSELDIEARNRGNSVYLVDRVIPMLPEQLSNEICSLKPNVPRFAFSVFMELNEVGEVVKYQIAESLIKSQRRFNYDEVQEILDTGTGDYVELLNELHKLAAFLRIKRYHEGGIEFDTSEAKFILDEDGFPIEVRMKRTTDATSLVEECMLMANKTVAQHVKIYSKEKGHAKTLPFLYRIHEEPEPQKIAEALAFIGTFGPKIKTRRPTSNDINKLIKEVEALPEKSVVHSILIRSMPKAIYSDFNIGHFGLGFKDYSHFTSPIRRYSDLVVHRALKEYALGKFDGDRLRFLSKFMKAAGAVCTDRERLAMEAERASNKLAFAMMAEKHVGEEFDGRISGVTGFGLFVTMDEIFAEGLLHIRDMKDDYYFFDEAMFRLVGRRKKRTYGMGGRIRVKIVKVNIDKREIDLEQVL